MVAELVAEELAVVETPVEAVPDTPIPDATTPSDLAPVDTETQDSDPDKVISDYLSTAGLTEPSETTDVAVEEEVDPAVEARAQKIVAERLQAESKAREEAGVMLAYREAMPFTQRLLSQYLNQPLTPEAIQAVLNTMNGLNSQSKQVVTRDVTNSYVENQYKEAEKLFPKFSERRPNHKSTADFYADMIEEARKGYIPPKAVEAAKKTAVLEEHKRLSENPAVLRALLSKATAPKADTSARDASPVDLSAESVSKMPMAQIMKLRQQGLL